MPWRRSPTTSARGASNSTVSCSFRWSGPSMAMPSRPRTREWGAVGADQVAGPDGPRAPGRPLAEDHGDAVGVLVEGDQLGAEADLGQPGALQVAEQDRLQVVLGHGGQAGRAGRG